jgi:hypothetical protein
MSSFKTDYIFGKKKEEEILSIIEDYFKDDIKQVKEKFSKYDYEGTTNIYELKSRTNKYEAYPDTLLPFDKTQLKDKNQIFLFNFTNGLYFIKYSEDLFKTFKCQAFKRNQRTDYNDIVKPYIYIPIDKLTKIK